jgi:hypothetical protein
VIRKSGYMSLGAATSDDHMIGDRCFARQVNGNDALCFVLIKTILDDV